MNMSEVTVGLLLGGISKEKEISLQSGKAIYHALLELGYNVILIDPAFGKNQHNSIEKYFTTTIENHSKEKFLETFSVEMFKYIEVVFIGLHGTLGEDGVVQSLLDLLGKPYVGSDAISSAISMDKMISKILMEKNGVKTPKGFVVNKNHFEFELVKNRIELEFSFPIIVKPSDQGSTIGLTVCKNMSEISNAIQLVFSVSTSVLIEEYIKGREFTVGFLGETILPVLEIIPEQGLYDYDAKYNSDKTQFIVPADISKQVAEDMQNQAKLAFQALGNRDYARADFILTNDGKTYCLEVNTLPGMTSHSLVPKMAKSIGIDFPQLIDKLINYAANR
jgi:D-alanine-D-alanine ligase